MTQRVIGKLDTEAWQQGATATPPSMYGEVQVFLYLFALNPAAQILAGEAMDDLAACLSPMPVVQAFFEAHSIRADSQSFYLSSRYTRDPQNFRPDSVAVVANLSA